MGALPSARIHGKSRCNRLALGCYLVHLSRVHRTGSGAAQRFARSDLGSGRSYRAGTLPIDLSQGCGRRRRQGHRRLPVSCRHDGHLRARKPRRSFRLGSGLCGARLTGFGIGLLAVVLMIASALNFNLGAPACITGLLIGVVISLRDHGAPKDLGKNVPWSVLVLVAGLFVIIEALNGAGALHLAVQALNDMTHWRPATAALGSGFGLAVISNLMNNLPSGLIAGA